MLSIQIYKLYAYHIFWARVAGRLIWARFSSKIPNAAPYPREVKLEGWNYGQICQMDGEGELCTCLCVWSTGGPELFSLWLHICHADKNMLSVVIS